MNKLMLFPLAFMILLTVFAVAYTGVEYQGGITDDYSNISGNIDGEPVNVDIPEAGSYSFDIWTTAGIILILTSAIAVGVIGGITLLGSGISEQSQRLLFNSVLFGGLWACLSAVASDFVFAVSYTAVFWSILTIIYIIGMGSHMMGSEG